MRGSSIGGRTASAGDGGQRWPTSVRGEKGSAATHSVVPVKKQTCDGEVKGTEAGRRDGTQGGREG